jgi:DNA-binding response OmpR family regulator
MAQERKNRILIVEDDSYISDMYRIKLESEGFEVEIAADGQAGLDLVLANHPDLMLLDIVMPKMDGFAVLQKIRKNSDFKDMPVVMLTNLGQKESVEKGLSLGANGYIIKAHFTPSEVVNKIKEFLNK